MTVPGMRPPDLRHGPRSAIPLYARLAHDLRHQIASGRYQPGDQLPTERHLQATYGCSRIVVQNAFRMLEAQGLVTSHQGSGRFAAAVPDHTADATIIVTMLEVLRPRLEAWLNANGLWLVHVPGTAADQLIIIPASDAEEPT